MYIAGNNAGDEEVDIGGNEPPVTSHSPMEIEKGRHHTIGNYVMVQIAPAVNGLEEFCSDTAYSSLLCSHILKNGVHMKSQYLIAVLKDYIYFRTQKGKKDNKRRALALPGHSQLEVIVFFSLLDL